MEMATYTLTAKFKNQVPLEVFNKVKEFLKEHTKAYNEWQRVRGIHKITKRFKQEVCDKCKKGLKIKCTLTDKLPPICRYDHLKEHYPLAFYGTSLIDDDLEKDENMNEVAGLLINCSEYPDGDIPEQSGLDNKNLYIWGSALKFRQYVWHCSTWSNLVKYVKSLGAHEVYWESDEYPGDRYV